MDPVTAQIFVIAVWLFCSAGILAFLRKSVHEHGPGLLSQLMFSCVGGGLVTLLLVLINLAVTGGAGLTGSSVQY